MLGDVWWVELSWPPRVRRRPLSEIALWITGSPASWRVSQTPECNGLLTATRGIYMIVPQRQPGKFARSRAGRPAKRGSSRTWKRAPRPSRDSASRPLPCRGLPHSGRSRESGTHCLKSRAGLRGIMARTVRNSAERCGLRAACCVLRMLAVLL